MREKKPGTFRFFVGMETSNSFSGGRDNAFDSLGNSDASGLSDSRSSPGMKPAAEGFNSARKRVTGDRALDNDAPRIYLMQQDA